MSAPLYPDWRWRQAQALRSQPRELPQDEGVRAALRYLRRYGKSGSRHRLRQEMPAFSAAFSLYLEQPELAEVVQTRVLADEPAESIAAKCGMTPAAIQTYEMVFFDVRPYLDNHDFIVNTVIGSGPPR